MEKGSIHAEPLIVALSVMLQLVIDSLYQLQDIQIAGTSYSKCLQYEAIVARNNLLRLG